jgi:hypothetical protein
MIAIAFTCGPVHPGLTSWGILSRPCGTSRGEFVYPGLTSWATLSRPYGTDRGPCDSDLFLTTATDDFFLPPLSVRPNSA